jgi:hypothetical protein
MNRSLTLPFACILAALGAPVLAQGMPGQGPYGGQRGSGWNDRRDSPNQNERTRSPEPARGIAVTAYRAADAGDLLGKGPVVVAAISGGDELGKLPVYEAAVVDELARRGYDTADTGASSGERGQIAQVGVMHRTAVPEEAPRKPISGEASTVIGNRGTGFGLALAVDLTKPKKAIVATRLDVRIRDKASGRVLWEGYAEGQAREGDSGLDNGAMAARLAAALFARFPEGEIVQPLAAAMPRTIAPGE